MKEFRIKTSNSVEVHKAGSFEKAGKIADGIGAVSISITKTPTGRPRAIDNYVLKEAAEIVVRDQYATVNYLCRKLGIGNARAGRIMDRLEELGIVGPFHGSKPRDVLCKTMEELKSIIK